MANVLPVLDILNNMITVNNYLRASQSTTLPKAIVENPANERLVQTYEEWKVDIWQEYYEGLLDSEIMAQATEIKELYSIGAVTQDEVKSILFQSSDPTPKVVSVIDDVASLISRGQSIVTGLDNIAKNIQNADRQQIKEIEAIVGSLDSAFDQEEEKLTNSSISSGEDLVASVIDVSVAVATEEDPIQPLVKGVTKISTDVITELALSSDINRILGQLENEWAKLDQATADLAQITMVVSQLDAVVNAETATLKALSNLVNDWSDVTSDATGSAKLWKESGYNAMNEWSSRMSRVSFAAASQTIKSS